MKILVTGGTGYIGSHTCVALIEAGYEVVVVDNLCNSCIKVLDRIALITGVKPHFHKVDLLDRLEVSKVFFAHDFDAVIHFAGLKAVGESVENPLSYYENNVQGSINLIAAMKEAGVKRLIFSSSATVYGEPDEGAAEITEDYALQPNNPYGRSKLIVENMLKDICATDSSWKVALLRYFNPVGAHGSGLIGEDPQGVPNNLMPFLSQVAVGRREYLSVYGNDYDTNDGTGVRDYLHVVDLADGHVKALSQIETLSGADAINLGTGCGSSVLELIQSFSKAVQKDIPFEIVTRREGDVATLVANPSYAQEKIGWKSTYRLDEMTADTWRWQKKNPQGYS